MTKLWMTNVIYKLYNKNKAERCKLKDSNCYIRRTSIILSHKLPCTYKKSLLKKHYTTHHKPIRQNTREEYLHILLNSPSKYKINNWTHSHNAMQCSNEHASNTCIKLFTYEHKKFNGQSFGRNKQINIWLLIYGVKQSENLCQVMNSTSLRETTQAPNILNSWKWM